MSITAGEIGPPLEQRSELRAEVERLLKQRSELEA
jgi:hypothetical protein